MKKIISLLIVATIAFSCAPFLANAQTAASVQSQIQSLMQQLSQLQSQLNGTTPAPTTSSTPVISTSAFTRNLTVGSQGSDVSALQQILINDGYLTAITTPSGYFGQATKAALIQYQNANGISPATGYFGSITMASLNGGTSNATSASNDTAILSLATLYASPQSYDGQNITTQGIVSVLMPEEASDPVSQVTGNTVFLVNGNYRLEAEQISPSEYANLELGQTVTVQGNVHDVFVGSANSGAGLINVYANNVSIVTPPQNSITYIYGQIQQQLQNENISGAVANAPYTSSFNQCADIYNAAVSSTCNMLLGTANSGQGCEIPHPISDFIDSETNALVTACINDFPSSDSSGSNTLSSQPTPTVLPQSTDAWSTYQPVNFETFLENPNPYIDENISLMGLLDGTFLPANNGLPNYIEVQDPALVSQPVEIAIANPGNYTLAVNALLGKYEPVVKIYGTGVAMEEFTMTNGTSKLIPVITAQRIDICSYNYASGVCGDATSIFPAGLSTPSTVETTNNATSQTSPTQTASNPRYFQLNVSGTCDDNGNGTITLNGYPYTSGFEIPPDDVSSWANDSIAFIVPSSVPAGTYRVSLLGYDPGAGFAGCASGGSITVP